MSEIRPPAVAGAFYPRDPTRLAAQVDQLLEQVGPGTSHDTPKALIVPHAGYIYSGPIAASAYAQLSAAAEQIERVVLLGPSHFVPVQRLASPSATAFATPLGDIDVEAACGVPSVAQAHAREHSLEVQLPFLQRALGRFTLVPMVVGRAGPDEVAEVLAAQWGGVETLILISSDLSHFLPYDEACRADRETARKILSLSAMLDDDACGSNAVNGLLLAARLQGLVPSQLDLRTSGDTAGGRGEVVGYGAFGFSSTRGGLA
jgi:MEMO1 family protein